MSTRFTTRIRPRYGLSRQRSTHGYRHGSGSSVRFPETLPVHPMSSDSAGGDKTSITTNTTDYPIFRTIDGDEIRYNDNPATIPGVMYEIQLCLKRTGTYLMLHSNTVPWSSAVRQWWPRSRLCGRYPFHRRHTARG